MVRIACKISQFPRAQMCILYTTKQSRLQAPSPPSFLHARIRPVTVKPSALQNARLGRKRSRCAGTSSRSTHRLWERRTHFGTSSVGHVPCSQDHHEPQTYEIRRVHLVALRAVYRLRIETARINCTSPAEFTPLDCYLSNEHCGVRGRAVLTALENINRVQVERGTSPEIGVKDIIIVQQQRKEEGVPSDNLARQNVAKPSERAPNKQRQWSSC